MNQCITALLAVFFLCAAYSPVLVADSFSRLQDPTRPDSRVISTRTAAKSRKLVLNSTLVGPDGRSAIINGVRVREGQYVQGALISRIQADSVLIKRNGRQQRLRFGVQTRRVTQTQPQKAAEEKNSATAAR